MAKAQNPINQAAVDAVTGNACTVLFAGLIVTAICLVLLVVWTPLVWKIRRSWSRQVDYYGSFDVGGHAQR